MKLISSAIGFVLVLIIALLALAWFSVQVVAALLFVIPAVMFIAALVAAVRAAKAKEANHSETYGLRNNAKN